MDAAERRASNSGEAKCGLRQLVCCLSLSFVSNSNSFGLSKIYSMWLVNFSANMSFGYDISFG